MRCSRLKILVPNLSSLQKTGLEKQDLVYSRNWMWSLPQILNHLVILILQDLDDCYRPQDSRNILDLKKVAKKMRGNKLCEKLPLQNVENNKQSKISIFTFLEEKRTQ